MKVADNTGRQFDYNALKDINDAGWGVVNYDGEQNASVMDTNGTSGTIDMNKFIAAKGFRPVDMSTINTPETGVEASPLESWQRVAIGFGNKTGNLEFLNNFYEGATILQNGKYGVKQNGMWHKVDEKGFTLGDVEESLGKMGVIVASAAGSSFGAGGAVAGASAGEYFRQQIGKKMGSVQKTDVPEIVIEGASALAGMALSNAVSKFGAKGARSAGQMLAKIDKQSSGGTILQKTDDFLGISQGSTSTLANYTDDVTNFKKWKGLQPLETMAEDVEKWQGNMLANLSKEKVRIGKEAKELGRYLTPDQVMGQVVDETNGITLAQYLANHRVSAEGDELWRISSPFLEQFKKQMSKGAVTFDDVMQITDIADETLKSVYNGGFQDEAIAKSAIGKIRFALGKARDQEFGTGKAYNAMSQAIEAVKDEKGKMLFKDRATTRQLFKSLDNADKELIKDKLITLATQDEDLANIMLRREIWKSSNHFSKLYGTGAHMTKTNISGGGQGILTKPALVGMAAAVGWKMGGLPGLLAGGAIGSTTLSPRALALGFQVANVTKKMTEKSLEQAVVRTARQSTQELGGLQPGG